MPRRAKRRGYRRTGREANPGKHGRPTPTNEGIPRRVRRFRKVPSDPGYGLARGIHAPQWLRAKAPMPGLLVNGKPAPRDRVLLRRWLRKHRYSRAMQVAALRGEIQAPEPLK